MINGVHQFSLMQLYDGKAQFVVPKFQREYAWKKSDCEELLADLTDSDENYFIGSIILNGKEQAKSFEVIDGQQRLTSISLALVALYWHINNWLQPNRKDIKEVKKNKKELEKAKNTIEDILFYKNKRRLVLQDQNYNNDDYAYILNERLKIKETKKLAKSNAGNRRLTTNFNVFLKYFNELSVEGLLEFFDKIKTLTFIVIYVNGLDSAYSIFMAINNRGEDLTPIDLIKTHYVSNKGNVNNWTNMINLLGDKYADQEQFFRNNYNAFRNEYNTSKKKVATKSNLINLYGKIIKDSKKMSKLFDRAKLYSLMIGKTDFLNNENQELFNLFTKFRRSESTTAFTLLMYLYSYQNSLNLSNEDLVKLFDYILRFFICRNITNNPGTGTIRGILLKIIDDINNNKVKGYKNIKDTIVNHININDYGKDEIRTKLRENIYSTNGAMARFLLCSLCELNLTNSKESKIDLWARDEKGNYIWTVEHILPEGNNIPSYWVKMIADGDEKLAKEIKEEYQHKLGNLTMTGYNSELGNMSFADKKERQDNNGNYIGYRNGLPINDYIVKQKKWTKDNIDERTLDLEKGILNKIIKFGTD